MMCSHLHDSFTPQYTPQQETAFNLPIKKFYKYWALMGLARNSLAYDVTVLNRFVFSEPR